MKKTFKKFVALTVLAGMLLMVTQCGFILYPERRGQTSGQIDPVVLVLDCLWLLAGIVPGVVALVVDFATGGIYGGSGGGKKKVSAAPGNLIDFRLKGAAPADAEVSVMILSQDGSKTVAVLMDKHVVRGESMMDSQYLQIPRDVETGEYTLALLINGSTSGTWDMEITQ